jgi:hypothetical protein
VVALGLDEEHTFRWSPFDFLLELGAASGVAGASTKAVGEVAAAGVVEVIVKEPKQISTGLARMSVMLAGRTTQIGPPCCTASSRLPYLARQLSGG